MSPAPRCLAFAVVVFAGCHGAPAQVVLDAAGIYDFAAPPGYTGSSCASAADCAGSRVQCLTTDGDGVVWPGGYCTAACDRRKNAKDPPFANPDCPGGMATCSSLGGGYRCFVACTARADYLPCVREGYSCWTGGCQPTAASQCDPTRAGACPQDGGAEIADPDGGAPFRVSRSCARLGDDPVGRCVDGCDVLLPRCAQPGQGCYASLDTGEGTCAAPVTTGRDGAPCSYLNGCAPGFGCHLEDGANLCRAYCRSGSPADACPKGRTCVDLAVAVPATRVGLCVP